MGRNPHKPGGRTSPRNHSKEVRVERRLQCNRGDNTTNWQGVLVGQKAQLLCRTGQKGFGTLDQLSNNATTTDYYK